METCAIVITSIFDNGWIERMSKEILASDETEATTIIFIGDNKTPASVYQKINDEIKRGIKIVAPSLIEQKAFESKVGLPGFILENSDHRRNLGYLFAWINEYDFIISMDDDNFPMTQNFINQHRIRLGNRSGINTISCENNAFNNCNLLQESTHIHPRGYPFSRRPSPNKKFKIEQKKADLKIGANGGMWTISPDVDAISWLVSNKTFNEIKIVPDIALQKDTYCPLNSQNTSVARQYIPAYYFIRMGYDIGGGLKFDRLGDIYSGYFLQKVIKTCNEDISFGMPLVTHERNSHNYLNDANNEWGCLRTIDEFFDWLVDIDLSGRSTFDIYDNLSHELHEFASKTNFTFMSTTTSGFYHSMAYDMSKWLNLFKKTL